MGKLSSAVTAVSFEKERGEGMTMHPIKIETLTQFQFVSNPSFAPDGSGIAFVVQHADLKDNDYKGDLYFYRLGGGQVTRLTTAGDGKSYTWTARGTLLFPSARDGKKEGETSYYEISPKGGEAVKAFTVPLRAGSIYPVDEDRYLILASSQLEKAEEKNPAYEVIDELPFWSNGRGFTNGQRSRLYLYHAAAGELRPVSEETADVTGFSVRGNRVLYKAFPWTDVRGQYPGVYLYDLDTGETRCLLQKGRRRVGMIGLWANDEAVVAASEEDPQGAWRYMDFYTLSLTDGGLKLLTQYDYSSDSGSVGSDARLGGGRTMKVEDGVCYFVTTRGDSAHLYALRRDGTLEGVVTQEGSCDSFDVQNGHVVVCGLYGDQLAELYLDGEQITRFNDMSQWQISTPRSYTFSASAGSELTGWVMEPAGYEPGRKYPAILHIHGGPRTVFGTVFHHEMQVWANAGYFVFYTNPRGSDGFGTEFGDISGKFGTVDYDDLMEFTDYVLAHEKDIDPGRVGVTGGSYGGFMTNWIIGHTDRFRAAASQRSIANWIAFEHMSDIGENFTKGYQTALTHEDVDKLWLHSPIRYVADCKTPTLFVHSDADYRCNVAEAMEMFTALKVLGVETRMCVLRGENHDLSRTGRPRSRIVRMREILSWMDRHLKSEETGMEAK